MRLSKPIGKFTEREVLDICRKVHILHRKFTGKMLDCSVNISFAECHFVGHKYCPLVQGDKAATPQPQGVSMNIEKQVTSLELSQKLKEAGYPQEGVWWWATANSVSYWLNCGATGICDIVAPTVAELLKDMPLGYYLAKFIKGGYAFWKDCHGQVDDLLNETWGKTASDAAAKMWLYLKEKGLLTQGGV